MSRNKPITPYHQITLTGDGWVITAIVKHSTLEKSKDLARKLWQCQDNTKRMKITNERLEEIFSHKA